MKPITEIIAAIEATNPRSAWNKGVKLYALDLADNLAELINGKWIDPDSITSRADLLSVCLNGASSWDHFSWGGSALIYDFDIAEQLCTPSELKKTRNGELRPNAGEEWLDVQARALYQAFTLIRWNAF